MFDPLFVCKWYEIIIAARVINIWGCMEILPFILPRDPDFLILC